MREAATKAGMTPNGPSQLLIAREPECASIAVHHMIPEGYAIFFVSKNARDLWFQFFQSDVYISSLSVCVCKFLWVTQVVCFWKTGRWRRNNWYCTFCLFFFLIYPSVCSVSGVLHQRWVTCITRVPSYWWSMGIDDHWWSIRWNALSMFWWGCYSRIQKRRDVCVFPCVDIEHSCMHV